MRVSFHCEARNVARTFAASTAYAEDNPVNQKLITRILERAGHIVTIAGNGIETVAAYDAGHFDLILMDGQMPEMDGLQATVKIRLKKRVERAATCPSLR